MKRIIATVLSIVMMLSLAAICSFAAVDGYTVDGVVAVPENGKTTLTISVNVPENANLAGIMVDVTYDSAKLTIDSVDTSVADGVIAGWAKDTLDRGDGSYRIQAFTAAPKSENVLNASAKIAVVTFTVAEDAELTSGDVSLKVSDASDIDAKSVDENFATSVKILTVDKTALQTAIEQAKALTEADYTEDSFKAVSSALSAAEEVLSAKNATQAEIDKAASDLTDAISALVKFATQADKDALSQAVQEAGSLNKGDYTDASYKTVQDAIDAANEILNKSDATQTEIADAKKAVADAIAALVKVSAGDNTNTDTDTNTNNGSGPEETDTPNTSDFSLVVYASVVIVALAAAAIIIVKRKRA